MQYTPENVQVGQHFVCAGSSGLEAYVVFEFRGGWNLIDLATSRGFALWYNKEDFCEMLNNCVGQGLRRASMKEAAEALARMAELLEE